MSALALLLAAPTAIVVTNAASPEINVAQATGVGAPQNAGRSGKGKLKELCEDGTKLPCGAAATETPKFEATDAEVRNTEVVEIPSDGVTATTEDGATPSASSAGNAAPISEESRVDAETEGQVAKDGSVAASAVTITEEPRSESAGSGQSDESPGQKKKKGDAGEVTPTAPGNSDALSNSKPVSGDGQSGVAEVEGQPQADSATMAKTPSAPEEPKPEPAAVGGPSDGERPVGVTTATEAATAETMSTGAQTETQPAAIPVTDGLAATETTAERPDATVPVETQAEKEGPGPEAAVAAANEERVEPIETTSETVTEETTRTSSEEVLETKPMLGDADDGSSDLIKILGAAAGGVVVGALLNEALNDGGTVIENTGDRVIVERDGQYYIRKDENEILRRPGSDVRTETFRDGSSRTVVDRGDGTSVVTIRDADGYVVQRVRILPNGQRIVLFDDTGDARDMRNSSDTRRSSWIAEDQLPRFDPTVLEQRRYVDYGGTDRGELSDVLMARPVANIDRSYTLRQVRENWRLRDAMPRLDLDVVSFDSGSAAIAPDQARKLDALGWAMKDTLDNDPGEVFLIEGHTDAVGSRISNLVLSDRRAETMALALTEYYDIPPENLITQGYGEEFLKIETQAPERANRRAAVRRITPLLDRTALRQ